MRFTSGKRHEYPKDPPLKESSWYLVEVAFFKHNPIHRALLYTGFLRNGKPGNYSFVLNPAWEPVAQPVDEPMYLKVLKHLPEIEGLG